MKRIELYYGESGSGKSTAALEIAKFMWRTKKLKTVAYVGDGSRATYDDSGLVDAGIIEVVEFGGFDWPQTVLDWVVSGYKLNPTPAPGKPTMVPRTAEELAGIGLVIIEGLSVGAMYLMGDRLGGYAQRSGVGEKIGQDSPITIKDKVEGGVTVGGNPLSHYSVAQRRMITYVEKSKSLPVPWVIWTAHERASENKESGEKLIGPEVAGKALTASISRLFNNTLHFTTAARKQKVKDAYTEKSVDTLDTDFRLYTRDHFDPDGVSFVKYKAVTRCPIPSMIPDYLSGEAPGENILAFYRLLADARAKNLALLTEETAAEAGKEVAA